MNVRLPAALRIVLVVMGAVGFDLLAHYSNTPAAPRTLGATLSVSPPLLIAVGFAWRSAYRYVALLLCALVLFALIENWPALQRNFAILYLLQQFGMWAALLFGFARSLLAEQVPLCTRWADVLHGPLTPVEVRYTRRVTQAWSVFFAAMGSIGLLLYVVAPLRIWSAFNNLWTLPLLGLMFAAEYTVRHVALPDKRRSTILEAVRLYATSRR